MVRQTANPVKFKCWSCKNVETRGTFDHMPPGGKVCPKCCAPFPGRFTRIDSDV